MNRPDQTGAAVPVRTALVVDDSAAARYRTATLLQLGGWQVHHTVGTESALRLATTLDPDLVVTDMGMRNGHGATLMRRLREQGCTAHFLVARRRTSQVRAVAAYAGALACLAKPVDPRLFLDVMRGLSPMALLPAHEAPAEPAPVGGDAFGREAEIAFLAHALAEEARRGIVAHFRLMELVAICAATTDGETFAGQVPVGQAATSR